VVVTKRRLLPARLPKQSSHLDCGTVRTEDGGRRAEVRGQRSEVSLIELPPGRAHRPTSLGGGNKHNARAVRSAVRDRTGGRQKQPVSHMKRIEQIIRWGGLPAVLGLAWSSPQQHPGRGDQTTYRNRPRIRRDGRCNRVLSRKTSSKQARERNGLESGRVCSTSSSRTTWAERQCGGLRDCPS